jgi:two-component system OmpR family response regulator
MSAQSVFRKGVIGFPVRKRDKQKAGAFQRFSETVKWSRTDGGKALAVDILIAEDEPSILESLDFILRRAGWSISAVTDGDAVLGTLRRSPPKLVVLDVMLPKRSGFDILKQIRTDDVLRTLPVLILTAKGQAKDRRTAEELGADGFVTKPYANAEVIDEIRRLIGAAHPA